MANEKTTMKPLWNLISDELMKELEKELLEDTLSQYRMKKYLKYMFWRRMEEDWWTELYEGDPSAEKV
jgi:hypothetical protein